MVQGGSITCDSLVKTLTGVIQMKAINPKFSEFLNLQKVTVTLEVMKLKSYWVLLGPVII